MIPFGGGDGGGGGLDRARAEGKQYRKLVKEGGKKGVRAGDGGHTQTLKVKYSGLAEGRST